MTARVASTTLISTIPDIPDTPDPGYTRIPNHLIERVRMFKGSSLHVYLCLLKHARQGRGCWPSQERLRQMTGISTRAVRSAVRHLEKMGLITTKQRYNSANTYNLSHPLTPHNHRKKSSAPTGRNLPTEEDSLK